MWRPPASPLDTLEADANVILTVAGDTAITNDAAFSVAGCATEPWTRPQPREALRIARTYQP